MQQIKLLLFSSIFSFGFFSYSQEKELLMNQQFLKAAEKNDLKTMKHLVNKGCDINTPDRLGRFALHWSAFSGNSPCVKFLLKTKARIDQTDKNLSTPLHWSCRERHLPCVQILVKNKANLNAKRKDKGTALHEAIDGNSSEVIKFLIASKIDLKIKTNLGETALAYARRLNKKNLVKILKKRLSELAKQKKSNRKKLRSESIDIGCCASFSKKK